ncbi:hypothetical protein [Rhizomonospora bruguierae]|uniref:hypothetical protein n=1 Tax=Rhizomonospora bruguierae TaxID=1581705 RepID=UPI001BCD9258|nr:hypothetical protein [Micromonospora sp. NBRC 107566]
MQSIDAQMRSGILVDAATVRVSSLADPFLKGQELILVTNESVVATNIHYVEARKGDGDVVTAAGLETVERDADTTGGPTSRRFGGGYLGGIGNGMTLNWNGKYNGNCVPSFYFANHKVDTCYEKWRSTSNAQHYVYNRWAMFTLGSPADATGYGNFLRELTIRSRQWKGYDRIQQTTNWQPTVGTSNCTDQGSLTVSVGSVSVSAPIRKCSDHTVLLDTTPKTSLIGLRWEGDSRAKQHRVDAAAGYIARSSTSVPVWSDYVWVSTQWCSSWITCDPWSDYRWDDGGWS